ncbi:hypothetical protein L6164_027776 [Bauhinia variegata]|uniref:Uncharacterized protein n=1 Tax=Bauhinia variegata TaxID=167791 RepID=A0ACB9LVK3_BAUVA|nr:hypothetical protein L6164_027776 [Bauhinia variegata]
MFHGIVWEVPYNWMSNLGDKLTIVACGRVHGAGGEVYGIIYVRHGAHAELYYRHVEEEKQYAILRRRLTSLYEEFISHKSPSAGFYFASRNKIEQKLLDCNEEAEEVLLVLNAKLKMILF